MASAHPLDLLAAKAAAGFAAKGLKRNDLVVLYSHPHVETIGLLLGAWRLGLSVAMLSHRAPPVALEAMIASLQPCHVVENPASYFHFGEKICEWDPASFALFLYTSGSSGAPKLAAFRLEQLLDSARVVSTALQAQPGDTWLLSLPLHHVGGIGVLLRAYLSGGNVVFEDKSLSYTERLLSSNARFASFVPTQLYRLLQEPKRPCQTTLLIGGAPLAEPLYLQAKERSLHLCLTYALTEMSSTVLLSFHPIWRGAAPLLGHPLKGRELKIERGELLVRGRSLFAGYGRIPSPPPEWFATGDTAIFDPEFGFAITGRKDLQFFSGGENIQPEEIEAALLSHPAVEQAIVVPQPDPEFGARPAAFVRTTASHEELIAFAKRFLPTYKVPTSFFPLPEQESLKPNRNTLLKEIFNLSDVRK